MIPCYYSFDFQLDEENGPSFCLCLVQRCSKTTLTPHFLQAKITASSYTCGILIPGSQLVILKALIFSNLKEDDLILSGLSSKDTFAPRLLLDIFSFLNSV